MPAASGTAYATRTDLANLGLVGVALAPIATGVQDAALLAASGIADSYLQSQYVLPLTQWGQDLVRIVCIIAAYDLMTTRGYNPMSGADQNIRQRYLDAIAWLDLVAKGEREPSQVVDSAPTGTDPTDDSSSLDTRGLQFSSSNVRGWTPRGGSSVNTDGDGL